MQHDHAPFSMAWQVSRGKHEHGRADAVSTVIFLDANPVQESVVYVGESPDDETDWNLSIVRVDDESNVFWLEIISLERDARVPARKNGIG